MNNLYLVKNKRSQTSNQSPFLSIENVAKSYPTRNGDYTVLQDVNLSVEQGEFICVIGHSGCGKSTLLSMVSGFNHPTAGKVLLEDQPITETSVKHRPFLGR